MTEKPSPFRAGNTVQTLAPTEVNGVSVPTTSSDGHMGFEPIRGSSGRQIGEILVGGIPPISLLAGKTPEENPSPEFVGENLGLTGPGSIDGHNRDEGTDPVSADNQWWRDASPEFEPRPSESMMGLLLDRIERLEDWRETLDDRITKYNKKAAHLL